MGSDDKLRRLRAWIANDYGIQSYRILDRIDDLLRLAAPVDDQHGEVHLLLAWRYVRPR